MPVYCSLSNARIHCRDAGQLHVPFSQCRAITHRIWTTTMDCTSTNLTPFRALSPPLVYSSIQDFRIIRSLPHLFPSRRNVSTSSCHVYTSLFFLHLFLSRDSWPSATSHTCVHCWRTDDVTLSTDTGCACLHTLKRTVACRRSETRCDDDLHRQAALIAVSAGPSHISLGDYDPLSCDLLFQTQYREE
jgi:hypothetical protein